MTEQEEFEFRRRRERERTKVRPGAVVAGERTARGTVGAALTPDVIAADQAEDTTLKNIDTLEREIAKTPPGRQRDILVEEHNRIKAAIPPEGAPAKAPEMYTPSGERPVGWSDPEMLAAHPLTSFATGAASLPLAVAQTTQKTGPGQVAEHVAKRFLGALGVPYPEGEVAKPIAEMTQRGRERMGEEGTDWWNIAGSVLGPGAVGGKVISAPGLSIPQRMARGAVAGAALGGGQPVVGEGDFTQAKLGQAGTGALLGGVLPGVGAALGGIKSRIGSALDLVRPAGGMNIATRYARKVVGGPEERAALVPVLERARNIVPGSQPTVAEAVAGVPQGSPLLATQKIAASTPGGPSAAFGQRVLEQESARRKVLENLSSRGTPEQQVVARALKKQLTTMIETQPGKIPVVGQENPTAFLKALIRDEQFVKSVPGGPGVAKPLNQVFNKTQMKQLTNVAEELKTKLQIARPLQKTNLRGGVNIAEETRTHFPQALSRPMMIANAVLKTLGAGVEPRVDRAMQELHLNPNLMARALEDVPPDERAKVIRALINSGTLTGGIAAGAGREEGL